MISGPLIEKKLASVSWATARAKQRLAAAGRAVQQHALGRVDPQPLEKLRIFQRQLDDFPHAIQLPLQPADVLVGERGWRGRLAAALVNLQQRLGITVTAPAGRVLLTRKSARRLPNRVTRTRSPPVTGRPSSRPPMYFRSRVEGTPPWGQISR